MQASHEDWFSLVDANFVYPWFVQFEDPFDKYDGLHDEKDCSQHSKDNGSWNEERGHMEVRQSRYWDSILISLPSIFKIIGSEMVFAKLYNAIYRSSCDPKYKIELRFGATEFCAL
jgi:hypothetical protein